MKKEDIMIRLFHARQRLLDYQKKGWFECIMATQHTIDKLEKELEKNG